MKKLILFLVRKRLGLKTHEYFQFKGQKSSAVYYFGEDAIYKVEGAYIKRSSVSLNWLLSDECKDEIRTDILIGGGLNELT